MKWKDYDVMSVKEKEEYNYRFKDKTWLPDTWKYLDRIAIYTTWLLVVCIFSIQRNLPYQGILELVGKVLLIGLVLIVGIALLALVNNLYYGISERVWLRKKGYSKNMHRVKKQ